MMKKILIMEMKTLMKILIISGKKMKVLKIYVKRLILIMRKKILIMFILLNRPH
jgi:hypothetical protein